MISNIAFVFRVEVEEVQAEVLLVSKEALAGVIKDMTKDGDKIRIMGRAGVDRTISRVGKVYYYLSSSEC